MKLTFRWHNGAEETRASQADVDRLTELMATDPVGVADFCADVAAAAEELRKEAVSKMGTLVAACLGHDDMSDEEKADQKYAAQMLDGCEDEDERNAMMRSLSQ